MLIGQVGGAARGSRRRQREEAHGGGNVVEIEQKLGRAEGGRGHRHGEDDIQLVDESTGRVKEGVPELEL